MSRVKAMTIYSKDCFQCIFDDCIKDALDLEDCWEHKTVAELIKERTEKQKKDTTKQRTYREASRDEIAAWRRAYYAAW